MGIPHNDKLFLSPSEFMRARRPELFSDSEAMEEPVIAKDLLSFYLDRVTERKDEINFESFCRLLAEKEICPNLLPQTGPTGGGDSKVDAETYPVALPIAYTWYEGIDVQKAATERWAFAFSAKRKWKDKIKSDIKNIAETQRGYKKIFFITNQGISDRERAKTEDALQKQYHIDIRILDRTWIVDKIFNHNRLEILKQALSADIMSFVSKKKEGPRDFERKLELEELENKIQEPTNYINDYQLTVDCLQAAIVARGLELPRVEVDGRFERAERIARRHSYKPLLFDVIYSRAWTEVWWHEDFSKLLERYQELENIAIKLNEIQVFESLNNILWLRFAGGRVWSTHENNRFNEHLSTLKTLLTTIADDQNRPNASLRAKTLLILISLHTSFRSEPEQEKLFSNLENLLQQSKGLIDFPIQYLVNILTELNHLFIDSSSFKKTINTAIDIWAEKTSEGERGALWLKRAIQLRESNNPYEAIDTFSKAQKLLQHFEYKWELATCHAGIASAYEDIGLLWAARCNLMIALNMLMDSFDDGEDIRAKACSVIYRLIWIEMRLGRLAHCLELILLFSGMITSFHKDKLIRIQEDYLNIDSIFALLLLKVEYEDLKHLKKLPDYLNKSGLYLANFFLLHILGHDSEISSEIDLEEFNHLFTLAYEQPAFHQLAKKAEIYCSSDEIHISFIILGCTIHIVSSNSKNNLLISETIASAIESMFSNFIDNNKKIFSTIQDLYIDVEEIESKKLKLDVSMSSSEEHIEHIKFTYSSGITDYKNMMLFESNIKKFIGFIFLELQVNISEEQLKELYSFEVFDKFFNSLRFILHFTNIFTDRFAYKISDIVSGDDKEFPLIRDFHSFNSLRPTVSPKENLKKGIILQPTKAQLQKFEHKIPRHDEFMVLSPINTKWWDKAKWLGIAAGAVKTDQGNIPILSLIFENTMVAERIFMSWNAITKGYDIDNYISITVTTDIEASAPMAYRFCISADIMKEDSIKATGVQYIIGSRAKTIDEVTTTATLDLIREIDRLKLPFLLTYVGSKELTGKKKLSDSGFHTKARKDIVIMKNSLTLVSQKDTIMPF